MMEYMMGRKILELNPNSEVVQKMESLRSSDEAKAKEMIDLLYDTALFTSGFNLEDTKSYANRVFKMMAK